MRRILCKFLSLSLIFSLLCTPGMAQELVNHSAPASLNWIDRQATDRLRSEALAAKNVCFYSHDPKPNAAAIRLVQAFTVIASGATGFHLLSHMHFSVTVLTAFILLAPLMTRLSGRPNRLQGDLDDLLDVLEKAQAAGKMPILFIAAWMDLHGRDAAWLMRTLGYIGNEMAANRLRQKGAPADENVLKALENRNHSLSDLQAAIEEFLTVRQSLAPPLEPALFGHDDLAAMDEKFRIKLHSDTAQILRGQKLVLQWDAEAEIFKIYPISRWEFLLHQTRAERPSWINRAQAVEREMSGNGQILIGAKLSRQTGLTPGQTMHALSCNDHLEIWTSDKYDQYEDKLRRIPIILLQPLPGASIHFLGKVSLPMEDTRRIKLPASFGRSLSENDALRNNIDRSQKQVQVLIQLDYNRRVARVYLPSDWLSLMRANRPTDLKQQEKYDRRMFATTFLCPLDPHDRLLLPSEVCRTLALDETQKVQIEGGEGFIILRREEPDSQNQPEWSIKKLREWTEAFVYFVLRTSDALQDLGLRRVGEPQATSLVQHDRSETRWNDAESFTARHFERVEEFVYRGILFGSLLWGGAMLSHPQALAQWIALALLATLAQAVLFAVSHTGEDWASGLTNRMLGGIALQFLWAAYPFGMAWALVGWIYTMPKRLFEGRPWNEGWREVIASRAVRYHQVHNRMIAMDGDISRLSEEDQKYILGPHRIRSQPVQPV